MGMLNKVKELGSQTVIYGLGDALNKLIGFLLIPLYLNFLDPAQYGIIETLLVTMGLMVILANMGLPEAVFRFYFKVTNEDERKSVISTIFFLSLVGQISIPLLFFWNSNMLSELLFKSSDFTILITLAAANIGFSAFKGIPLAIYRAQKRPLAFVSVNFTTATVMLLMNVYFVAILGKGVFGIMLGFLCGSFTGVMIVLPTLLREIKLKFDPELVKRILKFSVPLGLSQLPLTIIFMADRYILGHMASMSQLGIYALAHKLAKLIKEFIVTPFRLAWGPFVFANERNKNAKHIYSKMTTYFSIVATAAIVFVSIFSFELVNLLTSKQEYLRASEIVPILCYAFLLFGLSYFAWTGIRVTEKTYYITLVMVVAASINIPLNYYLVQSFGYFGAGYSLLITFSITLILSYVISSKIYFIAYEIGRIFLILGSSVLIVYCSMGFNLENRMHDIVFRSLLVIFYYVMLYYIGFSSKERQRLIKRVSDKVKVRI